MTVSVRRFFDEPSATQFAGYRFTRGMLAIHTLRADVRSAFDLENEEGRGAYLRWLLFQYTREHNLVITDLCPGIKPFLSGACHRHPSMTWLAAFAHAQREDLRTTFDLDSDAGVEGMRAWVFEELRPWLESLGLVGLLPDTGVLASSNDDIKGHQCFLVISGDRGAPSGIAEDLRTIAASLDANNFDDYAVVDLPSGRVFKADGTLLPSGTRVRAEWNVIFVNADSSYASWRKLRQIDVQSERVAAHWMWELERLPSRWIHAYSFCDEVWAGSDFLKTVFQADARRPVRKILQAVVLPDIITPVERAQIGLEEDVTFYLFIFDFASFAQRKNPLAVVRAFALAFPTGRERVQLWIKTQNADLFPKERDELTGLANDPRIVLRDVVLTRAELCGLIAAADAFVSLHRSEGFGRAPAEAMLLGVPVILTDYSGTRDFADDECAYVVDYKLVPLRPGDYPGHEGQHWAEPDIIEAARHMQRVHEDPADARMRSVRGQKRVKTLLSAKRIGKDVLALLGCSVEAVIAYDGNKAQATSPTVLHLMQKSANEDLNKLSPKDRPLLRQAIQHDIEHDHSRPEEVSVLERSTRVGWDVRQAKANLPLAELSLFDMKREVARHVDDAFYQKSLSRSERLDDSAAHYCQKGWRQGRDPSAEFSTSGYLAAYPDVAERGVNPLWHYLAIGRGEGRSPHPDNLGCKSVSGHVDANFYLATYGDVAAAHMDPADHYARHGRLEGRAANSWFNSDFYRQSDQTLATSGLDPLDHYAAIGCIEGRAVHDVRPESLTTLRRLQEQASSRQSVSGPASFSLLSTDSLVRAFRARLRGRKLVLSISHDAYTRTVGGTQLVICQEQATLAVQGFAYLHLAPAVPRMHLVRNQPCNPLRATLDGVELGLLDAMSLARTFAQLGADLASQRLLICHCLFGHDVSDIMSLYRALRPTRAVFWLHDFSSVCEGHTLLRNDLAYCGAPPPESVGCRICVHGPHRARHLDDIRSLFEAIPFDVLAPSASALAIWEAATALPTRSKAVSPHAWIDVDRRRSQIVPPTAFGTSATPVRVAFVGYPASHKGWPGFRCIVEASMFDPAYKFFHFGVEPAAADLPVAFVETRVTTKDRDTMRAALEEHAIDLVLVLSSWPETFSFVTYEAIAAGADVVALKGSGNVEDEVLRSGRGVVFAGLEALRYFFTSGRAVDYVRLSLAEGKDGGCLNYRCGSAYQAYQEIGYDDENLPVLTHDESASL